MLTEDKFFTDEENNLFNFIQHAFSSKVACLMPGANVFRYDWDQFSQVLFSLSTYEDISVFDNGEVPQDEYIETYFNFGRYRKRIMVHKFYPMIEKGASLVINKMQDKCASVNDIIRLFARGTKCVTNANGYANRGGNGTFKMHWDTHDVFAVQLIGKKRWKIYPPTFKDPLVNHKSKLCADRPAEPIIDVVLEEGDVLFVPRGWWHDAVPIDNQESFHLAVGVFKNTIFDYFQWILLNKIDENVQVRDYIDSVDQATLSDSLECFIRLAGSAESFDEFKRDCLNKIRYKTTFNVAPFFSGRADSTKMAFNGVFECDKNRSFVVNGIEFKIQDFIDVNKDASNVRARSVCENLNSEQIVKMISLGLFS